MPTKTQRPTTDAAPKRIPANRFTAQNSAENNQVFLWGNHSSSPFLRAVPGWKIVGYGTPPWKKIENPIAVMFEKTAPATKGFFGMNGADFPEGTRIWQHGKAKWIPGHPDYKPRDV